MSDDHDKLLDALGSLDWDSALDDWEKNTFVPAVAPDADAQGAAPSGEVPAAGASQGSLKNVSSEGTVIAPVPRELRGPDAPRLPSSSPPLVAPPQRSSPSGARGGLGQLFSKHPSRPAPHELPAPPRSASPSEKTRVVGKLPSVTRQVRAASIPAEAYGELADDADDTGRPMTEAPTVATRSVKALPESETMVAERKSLPSFSDDAETQTRLPEFESPSEREVNDAPPAPEDEPQPSAPEGAQLEAPAPEEDAEGTSATSVHRTHEHEGHANADNDPTIMRPSPSTPAGAAKTEIAPVRDHRRSTASERPAEHDSIAQPATHWLDAAATTELRQRASWLEDEARALPDATQAARALLGVSELLALAGAYGEALALANEARELAPGIALTWRQARQLMSRDPEGAPTVDATVEALDAEAAHSPTPAARAHAMLMAADVLRISGDGDAAVVRWNNACRLDPADVRAPAARAALALAQHDHTAVGSDLAENSELIALDRAVATALKLRGAARAGTDVDEMPVNDGLRRARAALASQDVVAAAQAIADIAVEPSLTKAALWLSAAFGATHIAGRRAAARSLKTLANDGDSLARRPLAARGIELGDPELVTAALAQDAQDAPIDAAERATLLALAGQDLGSSLDTLEALPQHAALLDALSAANAAAGEEAAIARSRRTAGLESNRALGALGRLLATQPPADAIDAALAAVPLPRGPAAAGIGLELAVRTGRWAEVSEALAALPTGDGEGAAAQPHIAAALVSERARDTVGAKRAWREALAHGAAHDSVLRAIAILERGDPGADDLDLGAELLRIADEMPDGTAAAVLRLEALARRDPTSAPVGGAGADDQAPLEDGEHLAILERVHRAAPTLGIGAFLAERIGRRNGDVDEVLRWIQERRAYLNDPLETALDAVREALLVADRDADLASSRLEEAHRARPDDVALRELYERLASEPISDRGSWREGRAEKATGPARALLFTEAALEHERAGDQVACLRAAQKAQECGDRGLSRLALERAEIATGATRRQTDDLLARAKQTESADTRRATHERLAALEGANDPAAALRWHTTILDETPRHKPSLRHVEHALIGQGRDQELERTFEQIAWALDGTAGGEVTGHARLVARLRMRTSSTGHATGTGWERTADMARLAATQPEPSLWGIRALNAHVRVQKDEAATLATTLALLERTQRPPERAALLLRASETAARLERADEERTLLEQAANEDPGDVVTWGVLAELREKAGETRLAAEACESLARTSVVAEHQLLAWFDAARIWLDEVSDTDRGMTALEQCAEIDVAHADVFERLSALYATKRLDSELARLLEKRLAIVKDEGERAALEVDLARALAEMGETGKAKASLESALAQRPDHTTALAAMAELCSNEADWHGAEQAYVRLARLLPTPDEQRVIYEKLGEIYGTHTGNLSRAEVAYKEVRKRAPNDVATLEKLVDIYKRLNDVARAVETQQEIIAETSDPAIRLQRLVELAEIYEATARDPRRAEQVLESARKEFPTSVVALRAMAEFYARQRQMPAMQILLDRAAGDARRSFAAGRFVTSLFEVLHAAYDLRGRKDAARVVAATLAAVEGPESPARVSGAVPGELVGGEARAVDPRLDELFAPEIVGPALRALLYRSGDTLDAVSPLDLRALRVTPLVPGTPLGTTIGAVATVVGLGALQIFVSPQLGRVALPLGSNPPALLVGEGLMNVPNERARAFVVVRAMKMILARASSLLRGDPADVGVLVSALFTAFNPSFTPQGVDARRVAELSRRLASALPRNLDPTVGVIALEAAGTLGNQSAMLGPAAHAWANRVALLAIGDPNGALDAIAWSKGESAAPRGSEERAAWIARTTEARELMTFSVTDQYSEARARLGL